jgi:hypothetical protein
MSCGNCSPDFENFLPVREMGYTGAALKDCKTQSHALLMANSTLKYKMFLASRISLSGSALDSLRRAGGAGSDRCRHRIELA